MADDPASAAHSGNGGMNGQRRPSLSTATRLEIESELAAGEQSLADSDQTSSDSDQTLADSDQASADRDQAASDRDQDASDDDLAAGTSPAAHASSRDIRRETTREREQTAVDRMQTASDRDAIAHARDLSARARDLAGEARDRAMAGLDGVNAQQDTGRLGAGAEVVVRADALRQRAARYRVQASEHRVQAAGDRQAAAQDRALAAHDRAAAQADRELLLRRLAEAETDSLTGTLTRGAGLGELQHEIDRCERTGTPLSVAYVDVVGLKARNDAEGQAAGDQLLIEVIACLRAHLRTYDHITRMGGDEFVCVMPNMTITGARTRFGEVAAALAAAPEAHAIRTGFAELAASETSAELIARGDRELRASRRE